MNDFEIRQASNPNGCTAPGCSPSQGWKAHLTRLLVRQFGQPAGFWGTVAGQIMARRPSNVERNLWTIELLGVQPTDRVLEIGFGPGVAIAAASRHATAGLVVGIDHSAVMLRHATRRNRSAVRTGHVQLQLGSVEDLSSFEEPFEKIYAVNSIAFWREPVERLSKLRALLTPDGVIALTEQPRLQHGSDDAVRKAGDRIASQLEQAGFSYMRQDTRRMKPEAAICVRGWLQVGGSAGGSSSRRRTGSLAGTATV